VSSREAVSLIDILFEDSPLSRRQAAGLAHTWVNEIKQELEESGVSTLEGLGILSSGISGLTFRADSGMNLMHELPPMEGYSPELAKVNGRGTPEQNESDSSEKAGTQATEKFEEKRDVDPQEPEFRSIKVAPLESIPFEESAATEPDSEADSDLHAVEESPSSSDDWEERFSAAVEKADESISADAGELLPNSGSETETHRNSGSEGESLSNSGSESESAPEAESDSNLETTQASEEEEASEFSPPVLSDGKTQDEPPETVPKENSGSGDAAFEPDPITHETDGSASPPEARAAPRRATYPSSRQSDNARGALWILGSFAIIITAVLIYKYGFTGSELAGQEQINTTERITDQIPADEDSLSAGSEMTKSLADGQSGDESTSGDATVPSSSPTENDPDPVLSEAVESEGVNSEGVVSNQIESEESVIDNSVEGITGDMSGYTLITGSSLTQNNALTSIRAFRSLGLPSGVLSYQSEGVTRYRMAVGVYPTAASADSARQAMITDLPSGTWVLRIQ